MARSSSGKTRRSERRDVGSIPALATFMQQIRRGPFVQRLRIPVLQAEDNGSIPLGATMHTNPTQEF